MCAEHGSRPDFGRRSRRQGVLAGVFVAAVVGGIVSISFRRCACAEPNGDSDEAKAFQQYAKQTAEACEISTGGANAVQLSLRPEPILRWTNPVDTAKARGDVFLWTEQGRPAAVLSLYKFVNGAGVPLEHHEFCSLSVEHLVARRAGVVEWSPAEGGVEFQQLAGAEAPADSARTRARQLRDLAARFSADKTTHDDVTRPLRLLSQPIYRYAPGQPKILDGALFAFVEGTDPDIFLLLEARTDGQRPEWLFACARMASVRLRVYAAEKLVWQAPLVPRSEVINRRDKVYAAIEFNDP